MGMNNVFYLYFIVFLLKYQQKQSYDIIQFLSQKKGNNNREASGNRAGNEKQEK